MSRLVRRLKECQGEPSARLIISRERGVGMSLSSVPYLNGVSLTGLLGR